jgi:hypothetical protein
MESDVRKVCVIVPELVVRHWWENLLHNRRANLLKVILLLRGNRRIIVINIPWYLERRESSFIHRTRPETGSPSLQRTVK